jgi:hypothetical protein
MISLVISVVFVAIPAVVFAGMVGFLYLGRWLGRRRLAAGEDAADGTGAVEAAVFALLGLLVAFSFSGAQTRLDGRRAMIVQEANAMGTAYLRLDLLPDADRPILKDRFRRYVEARITYYQRLRDLDVSRAAHARAEQLQQEIWDGAVAAAARAADERATLLVVPALNEMIDMTSARDAAIWTHVPAPIFVLLGLLSLVCALMAGTDMARARKPNRVYVVTFAATMALTAFMILNLEFPRLGFVRFEALDAMLVKVREGMR